MRVTEPFLNCRLCWRITLVVFGLILAIESIILIPSAWQFRENELDRLSHQARLLLEPVLAGPGDFQAIQSNLSRLVGKHGLRGIAIYDAAGQIILHAGEDISPPPKTIEVSDSTPVTRSINHNNLITVWNNTPVGDQLVATMTDISHLPGMVIDYTLRVAGLVAIIVLVVTVGTMLFLDITVLRPLLLLRESAHRAGKDPGRSSSYALPTSRRDEIGELIAAYNFMLDKVTESHQRNLELAEQQAKFLIRHDRITGLPNQTALVEFLDQQSRLGKQTILLQLSFRKFRLLDSTYGNGTEDQIACAIAQRIQHAAAPGDFVARLEDGRFAIARSGNMNLSDATRFAEYFLNIVEQPFKASNGHELSFVVYAGITLSNRENQSGRDLLAQTNMALARIHEDDHCNYAFYSTQHAREALEQQTLLKALERAINQNELSIVLQPKMKLQPHCGTTIAGAEALVRWHHPERGSMSPVEFIPLAESSGLIGALGDFVLFSSARLIRYWLDRYDWSPRLAINISGKEFSQPNLVTRIEKALNRYDISGEYIELEITETTTMQDATYTTQIFSDLRELGIQISIDDFGTGYSSLSYLNKLPVDALKIDKSFVEDIGINADARVICDAILHLGHTLGMRIIAEGIESREQLDFLCERKCDEAQGYFFGKPIAPEDFEKTWIMQSLERNNKEVPVN